MFLCTFILLYFYALVFLCSCSLSICLSMLFRPYVFRLYAFSPLYTPHSPKKINMLLLPMLLSPIVFLTLRICVSMISYYYIFVYLYLYLPMSFISMTLYLSVHTPLSSYISFIMYSVYYVFRPFVLYSILKHRLYSFITC